MDKESMLARYDNCSSDNKDCSLVASAVNAILKKKYEPGLLADGNSRFEQILNNDGT